MRARSAAAKSSLFRRRRGPLATEGDEGEDMGAAFFHAHRLVPRVREEFLLVVAPDEVRRGVFQDAGDVGLQRRGAGSSRTRRIVRWNEPGHQRFEVTVERTLSNRGDLEIEDGLHWLGTRRAHRRQVHGFLEHWDDVPAMLHGSEEFAPHPIVVVGAAVERAGCQQQQKMRTTRYLGGDLCRPWTRIDTIHIEKGIVSAMCELLSEQASKGFPGGVPSIADERGFVAHGGCRIADGFRCLLLHAENRTRSRCRQEN